MHEEMAPRIALIHALDESVGPTRAAFCRFWPEARTCDLRDSALSSDLAAKGTLDQAIVDRFVALGRYVWRAGEGWDPLRGILFTCSAFGPAIDVVKAGLPIPVLRPNEAAFRDAVKSGSRIGHDQIVAEAASRVQDIDVLVLGQFSLARAADGVRSAVDCPVITTPEAAIHALPPGGLPVMVRGG